MSDRLYIPFREFIWLEPLLRKFPEQLSKGDRLIYEQKKKLYDDFHLFVEWDVKKAILTFRKSLGIDIKVSRETASELIAAFQNAHKAFQAELTRKTEYPKLKNKEAEAEEKFLNMLFHNGEDKAINFIESLLNDHHKPQSWKESLAWYILTGEVVLTDKQVNLLLRENYIRIEISSAANVKDFRRVFERKYKTFRDAFISLGAKNIRRFPKVYTEDNKVILKVDTRYKYAKDFNKLWSKIVVKQQQLDKTVKNIRQKPKVEAHIVAAQAWSKFEEKKFNDTKEYDWGAAKETVVKGSVLKRETRSRLIKKYPMSESNRRKILSRLEQRRKPIHS